MTEVQEIQVDEPELETGEAVTEVAEEKPQAPEGFISAEQNQHEVNKQFKFRKEAERAAESAKQEADRLKQELEALKAKAIDLTVPAPPDPYGENYEEKIKERDEAIKLKAAYDSQVEQNEAAQRRSAEQAERDAEAEQLRKVEAFNANVRKQGFDGNAIAEAAAKVVSYGVSANVEDVIMTHEVGGLMTQYLAENPIELERLNNMGAHELFSALPALEQKANLLRPQTSKAPPPPEILDGGGGGEIEDPLLKGVQFE